MFYKTSSVESIIPLEHVLGSCFSGIQKKPLIYSLSFPQVIGRASLGFSAAEYPMVVTKTLSYIQCSPANSLKPIAPLLKLCEF